MTKKRKKLKLNPPLNMSDDLTDMSVVAAGSMKAMRDNDGFGVFTIVTPVGHYDFLIGQETANEMIHALRDFIAGNVSSMDEVEE